MANCACCGKSFLFGQKDGSLNYCSDNCLSRGPLFEIGRQIPQDIVLSHTSQLFNTNCPICGKKSPTNLHRSYDIRSYILLTTWKTNTYISCKFCAAKKQIGAIFANLFLGWWGIPWGIAGTPIQIMRNIFALFYNPKSPEKSDDLQGFIRATLAEEINFGRDIENRKNSL